MLSRSIADKTVEVFHKGQRIASHARAPNRRGHTTIADHMPSAHRRYGKWTPGGLIVAGEKIGPSTAAFFQAVIEARPHPEQGFRTCLGILSLARSYDNARVDAACRRAILIKARSVASIRSILKSGLDWMVGPSAIGSVKGMPSSMISTPAPGKPRISAADVSRSGSPAMI